MNKSQPLKEKCTCGMAYDIAGDRYRTEDPNCPKHGVKESKSFFDMPESEKKEIIEQAADASNKAQREFMNKETPSKSMDLSPGSGWKDRFRAKFGVNSIYPLEVEEFIEEEFLKVSNRPGLQSGSVSGWGVTVREAFMDVLAHPDYECNKAGSYDPEPIFKAVRAALSHQKEQLQEKVEALKIKPRHSYKDMTRNGSRHTVVKAHNAAIDKALELLED